MAIIPKNQRNSFQPPGPGIAGAGDKENISDREDGRNQEWQDRARVNLDNDDPTVKTNIERDFEENNPRSGESSGQDPVY